MEEEDIQKYDENAIFPELLPVWQAFKKNDFDFYKFMLEKDYELIEDEDMRVEVLMCTCFLLLNLPIGRFAIDWLNGYLDFFERSNSLKCSDVGWLGDNVITDTDILYHLYFCSTEEEIWKIMACGIGDIESLYNGIAEEFLALSLKLQQAYHATMRKMKRKQRHFLITC